MDALLETIIAELRPRLAEWYPDADPAADLVILDDDPRAVARVIRLRAPRIGGPPARLIVKAGAPAPGALVDDRPRLVPTTEHSIRRQLEFEALRTIDARLAQVGDAGFASIRALGVLPDSNGLVMEEFVGEPLHRLLVRSTFRLEPAGRPSSLANAAGRWLRILHDTPTSTQLVRQGTRGELVEAFTALGEYLAAETGSRRLDALVEAGAEAAGRLPDRLPTVLSHGDFAPRNILVDRSGRLAVIDLLAVWQAPLYEDLAGFIVALQTSRANAATRGLLFGRAVEQLESAFLTGYFGSAPVPRTGIRVFELLLLLDKWSARASRNRSVHGFRRISERLIDGHFDARSRLLARRLLEGS